MYSTDHYLVNGGTVTPDDSLITVNGSLSMTITATLHNLSEVKCRLHNKSIYTVQSTAQMLASYSYIAEIIMG